MRHEYDYPFTSKSAALKAFVAGSLLFGAIFFPNMAVQLVSLGLAIFIIFEACIPFDEYFYFGTVVLSGIAGFAFSFLLNWFGLFIFYWILLVLLAVYMAFTGKMLRRRKE